MMMNDADETVNVETAGARPTDSVLERLAARLGGDASARTVFGDAVRQDGATIVPVARVRYGFGMGRKPESGDEGGGGGAMIAPVGYIEMKDGKVRFRSIMGFTELVPVILAGGLTAAVVFRGIRGIMQGRGR